MLSKISRSHSSGACLLVSRAGDNKQVVFVGSSDTMKKIARKGVE